jgi:hypothetical protein
MLLLAAIVPAQERAPAAQPAPAPAVRAERLVKLLEIDERRGEASMELWRLGKDAVPALVRALGDPRDEIVERAAAVLAEIGTEAAAADADVARLLTAAKGRRRQALLWAKRAVSATGFTVAEWGPGRILRLDAKGAPTGTIDVGKNLWHAQPLPEEHFLIVEVGAPKVREVDAAGKEVAQLDAQGAMRAQRLPGGNTLIAGEEAGVVEFDPTGKVVWEKKDVRCSWAQRLLDGHTLFVDRPAGKLYEVDAAGEVVKTFDVGAGVVYGAFRLPDGNTLIASRDGSSVRELDGTGKQVAELKGVKGPNSCVRLGDGTTVVSGETEVVAFDRSGKVLWRAACTWGGCVAR